MATDEGDLGRLGAWLNQLHRDVGTALSAELAHEFRQTYETLCRLTAQHKALEQKHCDALARLNAAHNLDPYTSQRMRFMYTNHRGERAVRDVELVHLWYGRTEHHPDPTFLLFAWDRDRLAHRDFALTATEDVWFVQPDVDALSHWLSRNPGLPLSTALVVEDGDRFAVLRDEAMLDYFGLPGEDVHPDEAVTTALARLSSEVFAAPLTDPRCFYAFAQDGRWTVCFAAPRPVPDAAPAPLPGLRLDWAPREAFAALPETEKWLPWYERR